MALNLFRTKSPEHLMAEAAAPERQLKRALSAFEARANKFWAREPGRAGPSRAEQHMRALECVRPGDQPGKSAEMSRDRVTQTAIGVVY